MLTWLAENIGTIVIAAILLAVIVGIAVHLLRQKKQGKSPCGCGCSTCPSCDQCHKS